MGLAGQKARTMGKELRLNDKHSSWLRAVGRGPEDVRRCPATESRKDAGTGCLLQLLRRKGAQRKHGAEETGREAKPEASGAQSRHLGGNFRPCEGSWGGWASRRQQLAQAPPV